MPIHGPHAASRTRAPAATMSPSAPCSASIARTCREPGEIVRLTLSAILLPRRTEATVIISRKEELVQLPMQT